MKIIKDKLAAFYQFAQIILVSVKELFKKFLKNFICLVINHLIINFFVITFWKYYLLFIIFINNYIIFINIFKRNKTDFCWLNFTCVIFWDCLRYLYAMFMISFKYVQILLRYFLTDSIFLLPLLLCSI